MPAPVTDIPDGSPRGRQLAYWTLGIFAGSIVVRFAVLWQLSSSADFDLPLNDGRAYQLWARQIVEGGSTWDRLVAGPPLYPLVLAALFRMTGESLLLVRVTQAILGAVAAALLTQAGWRLFSRSAGILAGSILALHPILIWSDVSIHTSVLEIFLVCWALSLVVDLTERQKASSVIALGVVVGLLALVRESGLILLVVLVPWLLLRRDLAPGIRSWGAVMLLGGTVAVLAPVAVADWASSGQLSLVRVPSAFQFYAGNSSGSDGSYLAPTDASSIAAPVGSALGHEPTTAEVSSFYAAESWKRIRTDFAGWIALLARKVGLSLNAVEPADTQEAWIHARFSPVLSAALAAIQFGWLLPAAFLGAFVTWSERKRLWPIYAWAIAWLCWGVVFYHFGRHRVALLPVVILLAAAGIAGLPGFIRTRRWPALLACTAATMAVAVISHWPLVDENVQRSMAHYNVATGLLDVKLEERAILQLEDALKHDPRNVLAHNDFGVLYAQRREYGVGLEHFREAIALSPDYVDARFNLAVALVEVYEPDEAIASYRTALSMDPSRSDAWSDLGHLLLSRGRPQEAMAAFRRALALDPTDEAARAGLRGMRARAGARASP